MFGIQVVTQAVEPVGYESAPVAELMARLDIAVRQRNVAAAQRIIAELSQTSDGNWLLRQFFAAGLSATAARITEKD